MGSFKTDSTTYAISSSARPIFSYRNTSREPLYERTKGAALLGISHLDQPEPTSFFAKALYGLVVACTVGTGTAMAYFFPPDPEQTQLQMMVQENVLGVDINGDGAVSRFNEETRTWENIPVKKFHKKD